MPDWRNPADYEYSENLALHDWAWEFLRRSDAYREAWERLAANREPGQESDEEHRVAQKFGLAWLADPSCTVFEDEVVWIVGAGVKLLWRYTNPKLDRLVRSVADGNELDMQPWPGYPDQIFLAFDLHEDATEQAESARAIVRRYQGALEAVGEANLAPFVPKKVYREKFPSYIRLLDAADAGVSHATAGEILFPESFDWKAQASKARAAAKRLAEGGYFDLLLRSNT